MLNVEDLGFFLRYYISCYHFFGVLIPFKVISFVYLPGTFLRFGSCSTVLLVVF